MSFAHHPLGSPRQSQIGDPPVKSKALRVLLSKLLRWSVVGKRLGLHPAVHPHCHLMIWIRELNQKRRLIKDCVQHPLRFEEFDKTWIKAKVGTSPHFRLPLVRKMLDKNSYMLRLEPEWPECQRKWSKSRGLDTCGTWRIAISSRWTMSHLSSTPMLKVCRSCSNSECKALEWKKACSTSEYPAFQKQFWLYKRVETHGNKMHSHSREDCRNYNCHSSSSLKQRCSKLLNSSPPSFLYPQKRICNMYPVWYNAMPWTVGQHMPALAAAV